MSTLIGPVTNSAIDAVIKEIKKPQTKEKIMENIIDPLLVDLASRYYPYFIVIIIVLLLIVILLVALLILTACQ